MPREIIKTVHAPGAVGPYSQGVRRGQILFTAGQLGLDPASGEFVAGGIEAQTRQALENVKAVLEAGGASLADVVKVTVFLTDMGKFQRMNGVYAEFFTQDPPARSAVEVAALPKGGEVEIEAIAVLG